MTDAPLVQLTNIGKDFANGVVALEGLNLTIHRGDFLSLLGPSGCGKSTALRLIADLAAPSQGQIDWLQGSHARQTLGFVFQDSTLMPWTSVYNNVFLPLRLSGLSKAQADYRIHEVLDLVGLRDFASAYPGELSGGMKMRTSIARALIQRPQLLLMDEPFAALDEITRVKLNNDLLQLKAELAMTIVFVTHSVYESVYLSNRIAVFASRPGRIVRMIEIDAPYPRGLSFRHSAHYAQACQETSEALQSAMSEQDQL
ncbi:MAG: ABC transporter ATP-binding protein [Alphaproteobacteria bacterium]|nr:ABC transporter ATP-binding protein [Alphaproteobacteria bacterium]